MAVSGGADSTCLLHLFSKLALKYNLQLHIAHVNYGLRGKASDLDEKFVQELGRKYSIPVTVFSFNRAPDRKYAEEELREIRYTFFRQLKKDLAFDLIAIAHNQDDQAETFLLRLLRGSGLAGLAAMKVKQGCLIRPLLATSRAQITAYLKKHSLSFQTDSSNMKKIYTRNKVRLGLIPYLIKHFNPKIKENLSELSLIIGEDYDYLIKSAQAELNYFKVKNGITFEASWLLSLHPSLQRNCLREMLLAVKLDLKGIEAAHTSEIIKALKSVKSKQQKISFQGLNITRKGDKVYMLLK